MTSTAKSVQRSPAAVPPVRRPPGPVGAPAGTSPLRRLQRCAGNQATERLLTAEGDGRVHRCGPIPCNCSPEERAAKEGLARFPYDGLSVSDPAEPAEREADAVADRVMRMSDSAAVPIGSEPANVLHRHGAEGHGGGEHSAGLAAGIAQQINGGGQALAGGVREFMETRFGRDLGPVRVHADATAGRLARQADAHAFTVGRHVFFGSGQYRPGDQGGQRLLAHELAHVVQQTGAGSPGIQRQPRPDKGGSVPAEKFSGTLAAAYERLGDYRRAAAIRSCQRGGGAACGVVLTQAEVRQLYALAQRTGGDEKKIRAGLPAAAPGALAAAGGTAVAGMMLSPGLPPVGPIPPMAPIPPVAPVAPVAPTGFPTWAPPPPVAGVPAAEVGVAEVGVAEAGAGEVAGGVAAGSAAATVVVAAAVALLVVACVASIVEAWQFSKFSHQLEAQGFIVLDDALAVCIQGCHSSGTPIRPTRNFPDFSSPRLKPFLDFPPPTNPYPFPIPDHPFPIPDVGGPRRPPRTPDDEHDEPRDKRPNPRRAPRKEPHPGTDVHPDPDRREPDDPCDSPGLQVLHACGQIRTYDEALRELNRPADATSSGREPAGGDCFADGIRRGLNDPLGRHATHETWHSKGKRVGTIKCCPCCVRGTTGLNPVAQNCSVVF